MSFSLTAEHTAIVVAVVTAIIGPMVGAWAGWRRAKHAAEATAQKEFSQGWRERVEGDATVSNVILAWSKRLEAQVETLEERVRRLRLERNAARTRANQLEHYTQALLDLCEAHGCENIPNPPTVPDDD